MIKSKKTLNSMQETWAMWKIKQIKQEKIRSIHDRTI